MLRENCGDGFVNCGIPTRDGFYYGGNPAGMMSELTGYDNFFLDQQYSADASDSDLLAYWSSKDKVWRKLVKVARGLLSVPTSSTSSERSFTFAGNTLADRRSRLLPELVDSLMFLHGIK